MWALDPLINIWWIFVCYFISLVCYFCVLVYDFKLLFCHFCAVKHNFNLPVCHFCAVKYDFYLLVYRFCIVENHFCCFECRFCFPVYGFGALVCFFKGLKLYQNSDKHVVQFVKELMKSNIKHLIELCKCFFGLLPAKRRHSCGWQSSVVICIASVVVPNLINLIFGYWRCQLPPLPASHIPYPGISP